MTLRSQNGWSAARTAGDLPGGSVVITPKGAPDSQFRVRAGDVATVLQYVLDQYQARVEDIDLYTKGSGDDWGFAYRPIRGQSSGLSNHSSGTAVDVNSARHPLGTNPAHNFTQGQLSAIRHILAECKGAVRWGGDYHGRKDGMHFEIHGSGDAVAKVARQIRAGDIAGPGAAHGKPATPATVDHSHGDITVAGIVRADVGAVSAAAVNAARGTGDVSVHVYYVQSWLIASGAAVTADGYWGPLTQAALDAYRVGAGMTGDDATGTIGFTSLGLLRQAAKSVKPIIEGQ